jgi:hypothetical protein
MRIHFFLANFSPRKRVIREKVRDNWIIRRGKYRLRVVIACTEVPKPPIDITKQLKHALMVVGVAGAKMHHSVPDLRHLDELGDPQIRRREIGSKAIPV